MTMRPKREESHMKKGETTQRRRGEMRRKGETQGRRSGEICEESRDEES